MILLDTDHVSLLEWGGELGEKVRARAPEVEGDGGDAVHDDHYL
jgi:hypothetical protein